jgi:uncharacterized membrane protein YraQ (UPF0718 family)
MRRLVRKGIPLSVCMSYMLAGPIINVVVIGSTYIAFDPRNPDAYLFPLRDASGNVIGGGPTMVVALRVGLGFIVACITSLVIDWQYRRHGNRLFTSALLMPGGASEPASNNRPRPTLWQRLGNISETALHDFVDITVFLIIGAFLAAIGRTALSGADTVSQGALNEKEFDRFISGNPVIAILLGMGLAIAFCLCSEADAFVAANFPATWPPAAQIAFLVLGPMLDLKLYMMYLRIFRQRLIWTIIAAVVIQVFIFSLILHYAWPDHGYSVQLLQRKAASAAQ